MEVILIKSVSGLGSSGSLVQVKEGYAVNYLLPKKLAVRKTPKAVEIWEKQKEAIAKEVEAENAKNAALIESLREKGTLYVKTKVGEGDKLFGAITNAHLAHAVKEEFGVELDKRQILLKDSVKSVGSYVATLKLSSLHRLDIPFSVVPDNL